MFFNYGMYGVLPEDKTKKKLTKLQNNIEFMNVLTDLLDMVLDEFEWKGIPETCDVRMMESALIWRGFMAFFKDKEGEIWSYSAGPGGMLTRYGYPSNGYLYALNGTVENCTFYWPFMANDNADGVLCLDNKTGYPLINKIIRGAQRISDAKRALDVAIQNSKRPYIFVGTEEQKKSIESVYNDIAENQPFLLVNESTLDAMKPSILNTNFHEGVIKELWDSYNNIKADVLQSLGINMNANSDKKERMTVEEVQGDTEYVDKQQSYRLEERKQFCERVNEAFGLNISVDFKYKADEVIKNDEQDINFSTGSRKQNAVTSIQ